jgi:hypothetical protein
MAAQISGSTWAMVDVERSNMAVLFGRRAFESRRV